MTRLFGTDGIRGTANQDPLTADLALRLGRQLTTTLREHHGVDRVRLVVGRDTRRSGPLLESALVAGALSAGADVHAVGVLPTPGIAYLTRSLEAHGGVVLSASHNSFEDNGIKIFSAEGSKFPDAWEDEIEARLNAADAGARPTGPGVGRLVPEPRAEAAYMAHLRTAVGFDLSGMSVVLDCAHGATSSVAPKLFRALGAKVIVMAARPDGLNINRFVGALHPEGLQKKVVAARAQVGLAFDGDGDRLICVDERGEIRDGDHVLAICGRRLMAQGRLKEGVVVTTVMANLGLDRSLEPVGVRLVKTQVGDRYVLEEMLRLGANLGGEQSGHLLFLDHSTTGDGILSGLMLIGVMRETGQPLSELAACMSKFPQLLINVPVREKPPLEQVPGLAARRAHLEAELGNRGRILLRYSGTEALARVMVEAPDDETAGRVAEDLAGVIRRAIGR